MSAPAIAATPAPGPASFEEAYRDHAQCVARWARNLGGTDIEVEDVVQEVFLVVNRRMREFRGEAQFSSWLFQITRRIVANHRRRHRWRFWGSKGEATLSAPETRPDPVAELELRRAAELFYRALDQLSERYRTLLVLFEIEGLSTQQISELNGVKLPTLRVQLARARERFLEHYQKLLNKGKP